MSVDSPVLSRDEMERLGPQEVHGGIQSVLYHKGGLTSMGCKHIGETHACSLEVIPRAPIT